MQVLHLWNLMMLMNYHNRFHKKFKFNKKNQNYKETNNNKFYNMKFNRICSKKNKKSKIKNEETVLLHKKRNPKLLEDKGIKIDLENEKNFNKKITTSKQERRQIIKIASYSQMK